MGATHRDEVGQEAGPDPEDRLAAREFLAAALYMALVQWAALLALPTEHRPDDSTIVALLLGSAVGLVLAHWLAFRLAAHLAENGFAPVSVAREAGAQIGGGLVVGILAALPFLVLDGEEAVQASILVLAALPALAGVGIARLRHRSWIVSILVGVVVLAVALLIVAVKTIAGH